MLPYRSNNQYSGSGFQLDFQTMKHLSDFFTAFLEFLKPLLIHISWIATVSFIPTPLAGFWQLNTGC